MAKEKAKSLDIVNRTIENANNLSEFATKIGLTTSTKKIEHVNENIENYDIIINATAIGLKDESSPISFEGAKEKTIAYDIVYSPMNTDFIKKAKEKKIRNNLWIRNAPRASN